MRDRPRSRGSVVPHILWMNGEVRLRWRGLDGGGEVRRAMAAFVDDLRGRSRPLLPGE
jgi:hypothetical protein